MSVHPFATGVSGAAATYKRATGYNRHRARRGSAVSHRCQSSVKLYGSCQLEAGHEGSHLVVWSGDDGEYIIPWANEWERTATKDGAQ
jgi:hypothetical protein